MKGPFVPGGEQRIQNDNFCLDEGPLFDGLPPVISGLEMGT